jgi:hypothetical protein
VARTQIIGLEETLRTLQEIDPVLYREGQKNIKRDVRPLVDEARSNTPSQTPLSNWKQSTSSAVTRSGASRLPAWEGNAKRKINTRMRRERVRGMGGRRVLIRVVQGSASGSVWDIAGRINQSSTFARNLTDRFGPASRGMWPAAEKKLPDVQKSVQKSVFDMEEVINEALRSRKSYTGARLRAAQRRAFGR